MQKLFEYFLFVIPVALDYTLYIAGLLGDEHTEVNGKLKTQIEGTLMRSFWSFGLLVFNLFNYGVLSSSSRH